MLYYKCMNFVGMDKLSLLDYEDKVSAVLFCKPCNFRCPYCHNGLTVLNSNDEISWEHVLDYLNTRKGILDAVVFTGGEITLMPGILEKMKQVKDMGFLVKVDTNGTNPSLVKEMISLKIVDYIAMDIKNCKDKYPVTTDTKINFFDKVYETYQVLLDSGIPFELRTTLVDEFFTKEDIESIGKTFKDAPKMFLQKFVEREGCLKKGLHSVSEDLANQYKLILEKYMSKVELRGY